MRPGETYVQESLGDCVEAPHPIWLLEELPGTTENWLYPLLRKVIIDAVRTPVIRTSDDWMPSSNRAYDRKRKTSGSRSSLRVTAELTLAATGLCCANCQARDRHLLLMSPSTLAARIALDPRQLLEPSQNSSPLLLSIGKTRRCEGSLERFMTLDWNYRPFNERDVVSAIRKAGSSTAKCSDGLTTVHLKYLT